MHRDIKPANILIDERNRARLLDFGIARIVGTDGPTQTGHAVGTLTYMAPEQVLDEPIDGRADIYAFGICCYEMLTFHKPYEGEKIEQVRAMQIDPRTPPTPIQQYSPRIPAALATLVMKCIAKQPEDRYPDMALVLRDLNALA